MLLRLATSSMRAPRLAASPAMRMSRTLRTTAPLLAEQFDGAAAEAYVAIFESLKPSWEQHAELIKGYVGSDAAIDILDIGAGPGEPSCTLAAALPSAKVTCTDLQEDMNAKAVMRAEAKGVKLADITIADVTDLSKYPDASFDFITMNFALMFVPGPDKAIAECARVLKPGGKLLSTVWNNNTFVTAIGMAMEKFTGAKPPPPPPGTPGPLALAPAGAQEALATGAGLEVALVEEAAVPIVISSEAVFREVALILVGPKLKEMEENGRAGATKEFQDIFVEVAPSVPGLEVSADGVYSFGPLSEMIVMAKP